MEALISPPFYTHTQTHMQGPYANVLWMSLHGKMSLSQLITVKQGEILSAESIVWMCSVWFNFKPAITPYSTVQEQVWLKLWCNAINDIYQISLLLYFNCVQYSEMIVKLCLNDPYSKRKKKTYIDVFKKSLPSWHVVGLWQNRHCLCMHLVAPKIMMDSIFKHKSRWFDQCFFFMSLSFFHPPRISCCFLFFNF